MRAGPLGVRCSNTEPMGRQCRRNAKPAQSPPRNTASPSGPSAPQTTLSATAETAACGVPRTVAFGNEGLPGGCCDRGCGQRDTPWPIFKCHLKPLKQNVLWHLMWVHKQRVAPSGPSCASVSVTHLNNHRSGGWVCAAPSDLRWRF